AHDFTYCIPQLRRRLQGALVYNGTGNRSAQPLFTQVENQIPELFILIFIYDLVSGKAGPFVHSHVERALFLKAEPAAGFPDLMSRNPQIKKNSTDLATDFRWQERGKVAEISLYGSSPCISADTLLCRFQCFSVL